MSVTIEEFRDQKRAVQERISHFINEEMRALASVPADLRLDLSAIDVTVCSDPARRYIYNAVITAQI